MTAAPGEAFLDLADISLPKRFWRGTHRLVSPTETLDRIRPLAAAMGITRLGNITGLDRIGIPVAVAIRPNSRSVSAAQGKGLDLPQAMASALMEAGESFHAEEIGPTRCAAYHAMAAMDAVVEPETLCATGKTFDPAEPVSWVKGYDLLDEGPCWVPAEIVHTDYTRAPEGYFLSGSNGLASGNHMVESLVAAICEVVERDAIALWHARGIRARAACRLDLASVDDPACRQLLAKYDAAKVAVRVWNVTSDIGVPAFLCEIRDLEAGDPRRLRRSYGAGCHCDRSVALTRALTEAAQARLTYIAGVRDDLGPSEYEEPAGAAINDALIDALSAATAPMAFGTIADAGSDDLGQDLRWLLSRLRGIGLRRLVAFDLTRPDLRIPVVRVVIPCLEGDPRHPLYIPGPRARHAATLLK